MPPLTPAQKRQKEKDKKKRQNELDLIREENALHDLANGTPGQRRDAELIHIGKRLTELQRDVVDVASDGNCLFHALAHQHGDVSAPSMRAVIVEYMQSHKDAYAAFIESPEGASDPFEAYCAEMAKDGTWGSALEVRVAADCFHVPIAIVAATSVTVCGGEGEVPAAMAAWVLAYYEHLYTLGSHFNATTKRAVVEDDSS